MIIKNVNSYSGVGECFAQVRTRDVRGGVGEWL